MCSVYSAGSKEAQVCALWIANSNIYVLRAAAHGQGQSVVSSPLQPAASLVKSRDGLAAQSKPSVQEQVRLKVLQTKLRHSAPVVQAGPSQTASNNSFFPLRERVKEPEFVANISDRRRRKLRLLASHVGEVWFYPSEGFHLSNV